MRTKAALLWDPGRDREIGEIQLGDPVHGEVQDHADMREGKDLRGVIHYADADS